MNLAPSKDMNLKLALLTALALLAFAAAQVDEFRDLRDYNERMKEIDHSFSSLKDHPYVHFAPELQEEAARLADLFGKVERFWKGRGDEDKARFAGMAREGAEKARKAALEKEQHAFEAAIDTIAASCEGCHREPLDKYRLRPRPPR